MKRLAEWIRVKILGMPPKLTDEEINDILYTEDELDFANYS